MELNYIVYITTNKCNGKFYIGVHRTDININDGYIGNGIYSQEHAKYKKYPLHLAVMKYGYENFERNIIRVFPDTEEGKQQAYNLEAELVTEILVNNPNCYNIARGGLSGASKRKTVYQFDLQGNYLRSYQCALDAALTIKNQTNYELVRGAIKRNCQNISSSAFGFYWSYTKEFKYKSKYKAVAKYSLNGKFIRSYESMVSAQEDMNGCNIKQAIDKHGCAGGYQWRYYSGDNSDISPLRNNYVKNNYTPILMYDINDNFIKEFSSVYECVNEHSELVLRNINLVLRGINKSTHHYKFKYKNKDII